MLDEKNKGGRPRLEIDWDEFDKLAILQCTLKEIAAWFKVSEDTIERRVKEKHNKSFAEHLDQRRCPGKTSLRRKQFQVAMSGNVSMLIWLGKQWLGQSDKMEQKTELTASKLIIDLGGIQDEQQNNG
jgi:hypothetical protein